jgi:hypothetical protein
MQHQEQHYRPRSNKGFPYGLTPKIATTMFCSNSTTIVLTAGVNTVEPIDTAKLKIQRATNISYSGFICNIITIENVYLEPYFVCYSN